MTKDHLCNSRSFLSNDIFHKFARLIWQIFWQLLITFYWTLVSYWQTPNLEVSTPWTVTLKRTLLSHHKLHSFILNQAYKDLLLHLFSFHLVLMVYFNHVCWFLAQHYYPLSMGLPLEHKGNIQQKIWMKNN